jgi:Mrp family chromosome partitioning ATPase
LDTEIAKLRADSPQLETMRANRLTLTTEIGTLSARITDLATTTVLAGQVIRDATPGDRARPSTPLLLGVGAGVGLAGGALAALGRERWSRRVRGAADLSRTGLPVLAELAGDLPGLRALAPRVFAPQHAPGRAFHRLRNEVVAALAPTDQVLLVTGASPGRASTVVAANLAAALARADNEVILVGANVPELGADGLLLSHVFDIADVPGLTDVLTRRAALNRALQRAPRAPRLQVITPGGTASAAGLLQSESVRATLHALRELARFVVVEAPSAAAGADAQSLAGLTDAAIVVVEAELTRRAEVTDAAVQLRTVGTHILGAVVLPPLSVTDPPEEPDQPKELDDGRGPDTWINPGTANAPTAVHPVVPATARRSAPRAR